MRKYTHLAEIYGVRCFYNELDGAVEGTTWFNERLIDVFMWFDLTFCINDGFYIKIIEEL